jgi:hypothetical protein
MSKRKRSERKKANKKARKQARQFEKDHATMIRVPFAGSDQPILCTEEQYPWIIKEPWRADDAGYPIRDPHPGEATRTLDQNGKPVVYLINEVMSRHEGIPLKRFGLPGQHKRNVTSGELHIYVTDRLKRVTEPVAHPVMLYRPDCREMHLIDQTNGCDGTLRHTRAFAEERNLDFDRLVARLAAYCLREEIRCDCDWALNILCRGWLPPDQTVFHEVVPTPAEYAEQFGWYCRTGPDGKVACSKDDPGAVPDVERAYEFVVEQSKQGIGQRCCDGDCTCDTPVT